MVDPGAEASRLVGLALEAVGRTGASEVLVACTHGHLDHVAAAPAVMEALRARGLAVRLFAHEADHDYFGEAAERTNRDVFSGIGAMGYFRKFWRPIPEPDVLFGDGYVLPGTDLAVVHTPGHTRGSCCLVAEGGADLISGDTLFLDGRGRTDNFDSDEVALLASIRDRLCTMDDAVRVWPGHGDPTTMGREKRYYLP